jgi:anti-sigma B factor antagonist
MQMAATKVGDMGVAVATRWDGHQAVVAPSGEVDLASVPSLDAAIEAAVHAAGVETVVVDLVGVTFMDSSGISVLLRGRRLADEHNLCYRVVGAHGMVLMVLELTGVWTHLSGQA